MLQVCNGFLYSMSVKNDGAVLLVAVGSTNKAVVAPSSYIVLYPLHKQAIL